MASRASGGTLAAFLIFAAIIGFAGGAYLGTQSGDTTPAHASPTTPIDTAPTDGTGSGTDGDDENNEDPDESEETPSGSAITFSLERNSASAGQEVAYSGRLESGQAGVRLQLQRSVDGGPWEDFPVSPRETNGSGEFSGTIQSSRSGENSFRMVGIDDDSLVSETATLAIN